MPDDLYVQDIVLWSDRQTALLRRAASGERVNDLDWPHIIEEIEDVGGSAIRAVTSLLRRAIEHLLKLHGWPDHPATSHWRSEIMGFLADARESFTPGMRQRVELDRIYLNSWRAIIVLRMEGEPPAGLPTANPFTLELLFADPPDIGALLACLRDPQSGSGG